MRTEKDFLGEYPVPEDALYGIHACRARDNFPDRTPFHKEWFKALGTVKLACYRTIRKFRDAVSKEHPDLMEYLKIPEKEILGAMESAATEVASGSHMEHFIVPSVQGGAGTSINMNMNEIITNRALQVLDRPPGDYSFIDPIESANLYQSTNDVVPTALTVAGMKLLRELEEEINSTRALTEDLENRYRNSLRLSYTQMQEAVPSTFGQLFSTYSEALSRDWWRVSKALERIKVVNLGGGATGSGMSIPRFYMMEVVPILKNLTGLPVTQGENLFDATCNLDRWVEVHAILKSHAVNLEKMVTDLRLLSSGAFNGEVMLPEKQTGSSIMPGKVNPVIPEFVISAAHRIYSNDQQIATLSAQGMLELNAYLPQIGHAVLDSLKLLLAMNHTLSRNLLGDLKVNEEAARERLYRSPSITTALAPLLGYHRASELAAHMKEKKCDVILANRELGLVEEKRLESLIKPDKLLKKGFTMQDIREGL